MSVNKAVLFLAALSAAAQTVIEPRVVSETLPSGGLMQIKLDFTSPHPITTTSSDFSFDSSFESLEGVSILSPSGDAYGVGYVRNGRFQANIVSPLASLGTQLDYPFLMVAAKIRAGIPVGTVIPINFGNATFFNGPGGTPYSLSAPKNGTLTIGGSASITNIVPGGGVLPAGTTVRILGTGFNTNTRIDVNEANVKDFRYVSPTEIDFTMTASGDLTGTRFTLRGQNKDPDVTYFSYLRAVAVGSSSRALLNGSHPLYPTQLLTSAGIAVPAVGLNGFIGIALRNSSAVAADVQLELVSGSAASLGKASVNIPSGGQYMRTVQELFGSAPVGASVKMTTSVAIQALGLNGDDTTGNVTAFLPGPAPALTGVALAASPVSLVFDAVAGAANPASKPLSITSSSSLLTFTSASNAAWLSAAPTGGTTPATLNVSVNTAGLAAGTYSGTLTLTAAGATTATVPVTLNIALPSQLSVGPASLSFSAVVGASAPASKPLSVAATGAALSFTTASNAAWFSASPASGNTPATVNVSVNPTGLAAGNYSGLLTVTAPGATTQTVAVTLTVAPVAAQLIVSPASLSFDDSGVRSISVGSTGTALSFTAVSNAPWLTVAPASGSTPAALTVTANAGTLSPGTYSASVVIAAAGSASQTVQVSLNIAGTPPAPAQLTFSPASLTFDGAATRTISVASIGGPLGFAATANVPWLTVTASSDVTPATVSVTAVPGTLAAGSYAGAVTLTAGGASTQTVSVTLNVAPSVVPEVAAVVNGASQAAGSAFAPGQILTIYGRNIGPATGVFGTLATPSRFDTVAGGTRVRFNGVLAPILYASAGQVNTIVPYEVSGTAGVEVEFEGQRSVALSIQIIEAAPALFTQDASGRGRAAILNQDYGLNGPQRPAGRGTVVMLYATGGGQTNPPSSTGQIAGAELRTIALPVAVTIGGRRAEILYAGAAPGLVTGLFQVNVLIPADAPVGDSVPVGIQVGFASSPSGTTLSIN